MTMTEPGDMKSAGSAALWRRFRAFDTGALPDWALDDERAALELAAYGEGRLDEAAAERIEAWLAVYPEALADLAAARAQRESSVPQRVVDRAAALVPADPAGARVIPFRRPAAPYVWRVHMARVAVAASLVLTGLIGFTLGSEVYANLFGSTESASAGELFGQPIGVFTSEDSAI
ncbi:MAG: hypothetical protein KGL11_10825 [Alphaproteobacteria bacterium]|nr:hypothetical protein [Alphaproteobacteria bacterium]